jgi:hypothetical protein
MKRYIREVFIPEYAKNFNKGLSAEDIKFYGKIHFSRDRSENELNMHCHLIVSRKDQSNKIKISPLTNHRNTKKGVVKGGFDRVSLFQNVEKGFDKLFGYNRQLPETFEYCNTMKNGRIGDKLRMQEREIKQNNQPNTVSREKENKVGNNFANLQENKHDVHQSVNKEDMQENKHNPNSIDLGLSSVLGILTPDPSPDDPQEFTIPKKKRRNHERD